jgi:hypothetical protein
VTQAVVLSTVLLLSSCAMAPVALWAAGRLGITALLAGLAICLLAGLLSLVVAQLLPGPELAIVAVMLGTLLRLGIPIGFLLVTYLLGGVLADGGLAYYLLVLYPIMLAVETYLTIPREAVSGT